MDMLTKSDLQIREPKWALQRIRQGRRLNPWDLERVKRDYNMARSFNYVVATALLADAWDRISLRRISKATTEENIRAEFLEARECSEAVAFAIRKLTRLSNAAALRAETLEEFVKALQIRPFGGKRSRAVDRKLNRMLAELRARATTMEDFQYIFYYAKYSRNADELSAWAQENWDRLSKEEVDQAKTLKAARSAYWRSHVVDAHGVHSMGGGRNPDAEQYAAAKWDALAQAALNKAVEREHYYAVLMRSRNESEPEAFAYYMVLTLQDDYASVEKLYTQVQRKKYHTGRVLRQKTAARLFELCTTAQQAAKLYNHRLISVDHAVKLIKRFPELVGDR